MQFSKILSALALASVAIAAPIKVESRGVVQTIGGLVASMEKAAGITALEKGLDATFHGDITKIEEAVGITSAEKALGMESGKVPEGMVNKIAHLSKELDKATGVTMLEDSLDSLLGGNLVKLEDALGVTFLEKTLGLEK